MRDRNPDNSFSLVHFITIPFICTRFIQKVPGLGGYLKELTSFHSDISQAHFSSQF